MPPTPCRLKWAQPKPLLVLVRRLSWLALTLAIATWPLTPLQASPPKVMVVIGASGTEEYGEEFRDWAKRIQGVCQDIPFELIDGTQASNGTQASDDTQPRDSSQPNSEVKEDRQRLLDWIALPSDGEQVRWLILIGHGTHDANASKFNLRGADITSTSLGKAIEQAGGRWVIVNCSSCSAPFLQSLSGPDHVVVTATKSGAEQNLSRFGNYFSQAISDPTADLDHDQAISVLEAFLMASGRVAAFYRDEDRLATEQALLDDNGDKRGTPAAFFRGIRPVKAAANGLELDGRLASRLGLCQLVEENLSEESQQARLQLEEEIENLRLRKTELPTEEYYQRLEELLLSLAKLHSTSQDAPR